MSDKKDEPEKENGDGEKPRFDTRQYLVASQFAYTLVIATCLLGYAGHWLGDKLGGSPWNIILMLLLGFLGFAGEMWRMVTMFSNKKKD